MIPIVIIAGNNKSGLYRVFLVGLFFTSGAGILPARNPHPALSGQDARSTDKLVFGHRIWYHPW